MEEKSKSLWNVVDDDKYQLHVSISAIDSTTESDDTDEKIVYMEDLAKRRQVYGICGECYEPGTGENWCKPCNAKRFKDKFKNWTSGNKVIDEYIQKSQQNAVYYSKILEWIPFEKFHNITYITKGGFSKIYSAEWPEGFIYYWDIDNQTWCRYNWDKIALKSLNNSSEISSDFFNEVEPFLHIYLWNIIQCYGITQDPKTKEYMMVLDYCDFGNLRSYLNESEEYINCRRKINELQQIARGLLNIHDSGKVHKDFHSGNILFTSYPYISDLGMCQPANNEQPVNKEEGIYGVLPYMAPEVLRGHQYTKAADIYSFGIVMNEFLSEEAPFGNIPHDEFLAIKICKGSRPRIFDDTPELLAKLIMKCWDAEMENRPSAKELYQALKKWNDEIENFIDCNEGKEEGVVNENNGNSKNDYKCDKLESEIISQISKCDKIREKNFESIISNNKSRNVQTHPQAIYTSRLLSFKSLPKPVNSSDISYLQINSVSECFDCKIKSGLNEICQDTN
ncbi:hypothetical protein RclHR1_00390024 [Rhizophagus clarus]|uniref:Kinase-like domain-containing protein n=1 Tax=Rhizophagus clarus TaxID=94130 RepID=A0A2Z6RU64_9GLOM|nr:hypothetical protein RclHR1_00390024 [Rhizophagus clarus]GET02198.1 kinase-like domain-containing protein [Rhizophagus clarus]